MQGPDCGLPVRTGVEGLAANICSTMYRSPCANRGRREKIGLMIRLLLVSLCEQGSKAVSPSPICSICGLPVRTGVEGAIPQPSQPRARSPCANRGRSHKPSPCAETRAVSLCEQGSKARERNVAALDGGLPVRTGVEGLRRSSAPSEEGSPCANRGRRRVLGIAFALRVVSLCEQGSKGSSSSKKPRPGGLPVRTGVEG